MPVLLRPPQVNGYQVHFNDSVLDFTSRKEAARAAFELTECNKRGSLWEMVDLVSRLEKVKPGQDRSRHWPWDTLN